MAEQTEFETQTLERKKSLSELESGLESLCGMVNAATARGQLEFGVGPDGTVVGVGAKDDLDTAQRTITTKIRDGFEPKGLAHEINLEPRVGLTVLVVRAERRPSVSFFEYRGRAYIREGSTTRRLTWDEKRELHRLRDDPTTVAPVAPAEIDIVFDAAYHDVLGLGTRARRSAWRIGVRARTTVRLAGVRLVITDIRAVEQADRPPLVWIARPVPSSLRYWPDASPFTETRDGIAVEVGATELFGFVYWLLDQRELHLDSLEDASPDYSPIPAHRRLRFGVRATASNAVAVTATFDVWVDGGALHCERLAEPALRVASPAESFPGAPLLRWQSPMVRIGNDLGIALDVLCSNEGGTEAIARVRSCEATLAGWGPLTFEEFGPGASIYPVLGGIDRRFTLQIRSGARGAMNLGPCSITWSVVYTDAQMRAYLTTATVDVEVLGKGEAPITSEALDETDARTRYERYAALVQSAPNSVLVVRST